MTNKRIFSVAHAALLTLCVVGGCTYTVPDEKLARLDVPPGALRPRMEYTLGSFAFALAGREMAPYSFEGRHLVEELALSWQRRGYVDEAKYVDAAAFSSTADYHLTLNGALRAETSFGMQVLNALTLFLLPYTVTQHYDVECILEDTGSGGMYVARLQTSEKTWVDLLLVLALPWAQRGHLATVDRMGEHLYDQLQRQGAFQGRCEAAPFP